MKKTFKKTRKGGRGGEATNAERGLEKTLSKKKGRGSLTHPGKRGLAPLERKPGPLGGA